MILLFLFYKSISIFSFLLTFYDSHTFLRFFKFQSELRKERDQRSGEAAERSGFLGELIGGDRGEVSLYNLIYKSCV